MKQKKKVLIKKTLKKKETTSYQTATIFWSRQEKNLRTPSKACLPSNYPLSKVKVVLMWSWLLSWLDSFQLFGIQSLTV